MHQRPGGPANRVGGPCVGTGAATQIGGDPAELTPRAGSPLPCVTMAGPVVLLGADPFAGTPAALVEALAGRSVLVLPTAAAFTHPQRAATRAVEWLAAQGVQAEVAAVLNRRDAADPAIVAAASAAGAYLLTDGTAMHARSVFKDTPLWEAMCVAHGAGAAMVGAGGGAVVLCDPMADERGGGLTLGLGLLSRMAVLAGHHRWPGHMVKRMRDLAGPDIPIATVGEAAALVHDAAGWRAYGVVDVHVAGQPATLDALSRR